MNDFVQLRHDGNGNFVEHTPGFGHEPTPAPVKPVMHGGVLKLNTAGGGVSTSGVTTYQSANTEPATGDILSTATTPAGSPTGNLTDKTLVNYGGMKIELATAATMGLVRKNADGSYSALESGPESTQSPPQTEQQQAAPEVAQANTEELLPPQVESKLVALQQAIPQAFLDKAVSEVITRFDVAAPDLELLANNSGLPVEAVAPTFQSIQQGFQDQADTAIKRAGVENPWDFYNWAKVNRADQLRDAMRQQVYGATTRPYLVLVDQYKRAISTGKAK